MCVFLTDYFSVLKTLLWRETLSVLCVRNSLVLFPFQLELQAACYNEIMTLRSTVVEVTGCELLFLSPQRLPALVFPLISEVKEVLFFVRPIPQSTHWIPSLPVFAFYLLFFPLPGYSVSPHWLFQETYSDFFVLKYFLLIGSPLSCYSSAFFHCHTLRV